MSRSHKILFALLVVVIGVLGASTGFFYSKSITLKPSTNEPATNDTSEVSKKISDTATQTNTPTPTVSGSEVTSAAPLGNRPSSPTDTVTISAGETLFSIGQKVGVSWMALAQANGIDADKIQAGQTLIVPKNNMVSYTVNQEKAASIQDDVDGGKNTFRLSPVDTAKSDSAPAYGILTTDKFVQNKIDLNAGTAQVIVSHTGKSYLITLTQPVTKGAKGIWAITSIKPMS